MEHHITWSKCLPSFAMHASARRVQESQTRFRMPFDDFPERRFKLTAKLQTEKLPGDLQNSEYLFVASFQFREELNAVFLLAAKTTLIQAKTTLIHFESAEIAKMLHNVYKGSCALGSIL
jgi:hypothetical protein